MLVFVIPALPVVVPVIVFPARVRLYYPNMGDERRRDEMSRNRGSDGTGRAPERAGAVTAAADRQIPYEGGKIQQLLGMQEKKNISALEKSLISAVTLPGLHHCRSCIPRIR